MNIFDLAAKITADTSDFDRKVGSMVSSGIEKFAKLTAAAGAAVAGFTGAAVKTGSEFDKAMSQVQATMLKSNDEMREEVGKSSSAYGDFEGNLREFAQFLGENTVFSATEAAKALNYMALAGYETQESMDMLPNVLALAAAGNFDLARASDMVTDTQTAFGISAERTSQLVDEMAKTASISNTSVEQLGDAFLVIGGLAQELNGGMVELADGTKQPVDKFQELEIALGSMANAGIKGSEAGTHMRNMLLKLSAPTKEGQMAFDALGVSIFDAEGNMKSLKDIFGDLSTAMDNLTQQQKLEAISDIFNTRDTASAEALLNAIGQDWDKIGEGILNASGAAADMSKIQLDNLTGDVTLFKSAFEGLQIAISDEVTPSLRDFVQRGTEWIGELTEKVKKGALRDFIDKARSSLDRLKEAISPVTNKFKELFGAQEEGSIVTQIIYNIFDGMISITEKLAPYIANVVDWIAKFFEWITSGSDSANAFIAILIGVAGAITAFLAIAEGLKTVFFIVEGFKALGSVFEFLSANPIVLIIAAIVALVAALVYLYNNNEEFREKVQAIWEAITGFFEKAAEIAKKVWQAVVEFFTKAWETIKEVWSVVHDFFSAIWNGIKEIFTPVAEWLSDKFKKAWELIKSVWNAVISFYAGIWAGIKEVFAPVVDWFGDRFEKSWENIKLVWQIAVYFFEQIWNGIKEVFGPVVHWISDRFEEAWENIKFVWDVVVYFFEQIWDGISGVFHSVGEWFREKFESAWENIRNVFEPVVDFFSGIWDSITGTFDGIGDTIRGFFDLDWFSVGHNIITGIANGVTGAAGWLWDSIWSAVDSAWNNLLNWLDIASPSKRARDEIGKMWSRGIGIGFEQGMPIDDMVGAVEDAFNAVEGVEPVDLGTVDYDVSDIDTSGTRVGGTYGEGGVVINVYATERQDEEEIAREVQRVFIQWENQRRAAYA